MTLAQTAVLSKPRSKRPKNDAIQGVDLLTLAGRVFVAYAECLRLRQWAQEVRQRNESNPDCPPCVSPATERAAYERWCEFVFKDGDREPHKEWQRAMDRVHRDIRVIFATPASSTEEAIAKLRIVQLAYGEGDVGDEDLLVHQPSNKSWLARVISDLESLAVGKRRPHNIIPAIAAE